MKKILLTLSLTFICGFVDGSIIGGLRVVNPICGDVRFTISSDNVDYYGQNQFINLLGIDHLGALTCVADLPEKANDMVQVTCLSKDNITFQGTHTGKSCIGGTGKSIVFNAQINPVMPISFMQYGIYFKKDGQRYVVRPVKQTIED